MEDKTIYSKIRDNDRDAFNLLVDEYNVALNAFVSHLLKDDSAAEDIVQDVFVNLWFNRKKVDFEIPVRNYLYVSARNLAYNHIRSLRRFREHAQRSSEFDEMAGFHIVEEETTRLLNNAITKLPPRTAEVIRLSLEGLKQDEIAERMDVGVANVKLLKSRGIAKLREILGPMAFLLIGL